MTSWPKERIEKVRRQREAAQAEIARRRGQ
jgi:hypothetical protein